MEEMIREIKKFIIKNYNSDDCGLTEECSEGNSMDVFIDGYNCGRSQLAYEIGIMLKMELEEPKEQKYSWED